MKLKQGLIVSALAVFALLVGVLPAVAQTTMRCTGTVSGELRANVVVPSGQTCVVEDATVTGNVTVGRGADLEFATSTLNGNVAIQNDGFALVLDSALNGSVRMNTAFGLEMDASGAAGTITSNNSTYLYMTDSDARSTVRVSGGEVFISDNPPTGLGSRITGDVITNDTEYTDVFNSVLYSDLSITNAEFGSVLCTSEIDGRASIVGSSETLQIGAEGPFPGCGYNVMSGDVDLFDNTADIQVAGNTIRGNLNCEGNDPAPVLGANRLRGEGTGQCAPADDVNAAQQDATARLFSNEAAATDRHAELEAQLAERRAQAGFTEPTPEEQAAAEQNVEDARAADAEAAPEPAPARIEGRALPSRSDR